MQRPLHKLIVLSAAFAFSASAFAWGHEGHRLTGLVAEKFLTPRTKEQLAALLPGMSLADVATWMDEQRPALLEMDPTTPQWHFDDMPVCGKAKLADYCPDGNCATEKTKTYLTTLSDSDSTAQEQADAVKFIVHMVGDLHQPLHAADNHDRGGNQVTVKVNGKSVKLHHAWDTELVEQAQGGKSEEDFVNDLVNTYGDMARAAAKGNVDQWASESNRFAVKFTYAKLTGFACRQPIKGTTTLSDAYTTGAVKLIQQQITKAGARIAFLLNGALDN